MTIPKPQTEASITSYNVSALMTQTRKLAADYHKQTGQALPVTEELARFDAVNLLGLKKLQDIDGVDACDHLELNNPDKQLNQYLIKGRVIFKAGKARQKLGKLGIQPEWSNLLMVIYDPEYQPIYIYNIEREIIDKQMDGIAPDKRGSMTVAKYKAIGQLVWESTEQPDSDQEQADLKQEKSKQANQD